MPKIGRLGNRRPCRVVRVGTARTVVKQHRGERAVASWFAEMRLQVKLSAGFTVMWLALDRMTSDDHTFILTAQREHGRHLSHWKYTMGNVIVYRADLRKSSAAGSRTE